MKKLILLFSILILTTVAVITDKQKKIEDENNRIRIFTDEIVDGSNDLSEEEIMEKFMNRYDKYEKFGLIYAEESDKLYFNGKEVKEFCDGKECIFDNYNVGELHIRAVYNNEKLIGIEEFKDGIQVIQLS